MFKLKYAKTCDNKIFEKYHLKPIVEDYYIANNNHFCIADGVTRDTINGEAVPYPKNEEEAKAWVQTYPNPSGAFEAAKICGDHFIQYLKESDLQEFSDTKILEIVKKVNQDIFQINKNREIDYLANDYYGCVAVGAYISSNTLYCFSIGDCHIMTLDENGNVQFETINNHKPFEDYLENVYCKQNVYNWNCAVGTEDNVLHLGDLYFDEGYKYLARLNGKKILVVGNNDVGKLKRVKSLEEWSICQKLKLQIPEAKRIRNKLKNKFGKDLKNPYLNAIVLDLGGERVMFSHFPVMNRKKDDRFYLARDVLDEAYRLCDCSLNIHGHTHTKKTYNRFCVNVSCEEIEFTPIQLKEIIKP